MSYDLYCYRSYLGKPDEEEANSVIETDMDKWAKKERNAATKLAIVQALTAYNSQLEAIDFDYGDIAKLTPTIIEEAGKKFDHIEINYSEGGLALRMTVYDNHVFLTVPYWYQDQKANELFKDIKAYINIISETTGYFIYDPQTDQVYDPKEIAFDGLNKYLSLSANRGND